MNQLVDVKVYSINSRQTFHLIVITKDLEKFQDFWHFLPSKELYGPHEAVNSVHLIKLTSIDELRDVFALCLLCYSI